MSDHMRPDSSNVVNTVFVEQRVLNTQPAQEANLMSIPNSIEMEMADGKWQALDQLKKPILLEQVIWSSTQTPGTNLTTYEFPEVLTTRESLIRRTLSMYAYFRFTPIFRFQINATQFHQGQVIISFDPFSQSVERESVPTDYNGYYSTPIFNRFGATGLPNVKIMASESDPVELEIPFIHPRNYFTTNSSSGFDLLGRIRMTVLNQLKFAEGASPSLTITTWLYARDAAVHVPIYYHDLQIPELMRSSAIMDEVTNLIGNGTNLVGNIMTGQVGKALRTGQGIIDNLGSMFGFDYPTRPVNSEKCIMPIEALAHGKGVSRAQRLVLDPVSHHPSGNEESSASSDPMDLMEIVKTPMLFRQFIWSTSMPAGTLLGTVVVQPQVGAAIDTINSRTVYQPTFLGYVSSRFKFWRGGITYSFEFVATHFHSGKLLVGFVPNAINTEPTYEQVSSSCPSIIMDIQQTSSVSFTVPYVSPTPLKSYDSPVDDDNRIGTIYYFVQNPLVAASNVVKEIDVNMYVNAADDYQLFVPSKPALLPAVTVTAPAEIMRSSADVNILTNTMTKEEPQATLAYGRSEIQPRPRFGENYALIDVIRRYDLASNAILAEQISQMPYPQVKSNSYLVNPTHLYDPQRQQMPVTSLLAHFALLFSAWTGSIRYKLVTTETRTSNKYVTIVHTPEFKQDYYQEEQLNGYATVRTNLAQDNAIEYEVPFYSVYNMLLTIPPAYAQGAERTEPIDNGYVNLIVSENPLPQPGSTPTSTTAQVYMAAGEDFRLLYRRCPPTVTVLQPTDLYFRGVS